MMSSALLADLLGQVSADRMTATVAALAGDGFAGRRVGSAGGAAARAWLVDQLASLGASLTTDAFPVRSVPQVYAGPAAMWGGDDTTASLAFGRQVAIHTASAQMSEVRRGPLGVAGREDPAGRWLVVPAGTSLFDAYRDTQEAVGLLMSRAVDAGGWQFTTLAGPNPGPLPILTLDADTHRDVLAAASTAGSWFSGNAPLRRDDVTGVNVHAAVRAPARPHDIDLLLTAHYDGVGDHPGLRQPGASDNASGVGVVLEVARILSAGLPEGIGLSVALLDGEEVGALGSAHHAAQLRAAGPHRWSSMSTAPAAWTGQRRWRPAVLPTGSWRCSTRRDGTPASLSQRVRWHRTTAATAEPVSPRWESEPAWLGTTARPTPRTASTRRR